jgi:hypothetical protein
LLRETVPQRGMRTINNNVAAVFLGNGATVREMIRLWTWSLLGKSPVAQMFKNFFTFYGIRMFITVSTRTHHWSLTKARYSQSISSNPLFPGFTHINIDLHSIFFPSGFPTNSLYAFIVSIRTTSSAHAILLDMIILIIYGEGYKVWSSSLCTSLHTLVTSHLLDKLFSNTANDNTIIFLCTLRF